jgi:glyoxylase-like metal-dependent hydrolase (beta-lactamase superfamily II)
MTGPERIAEGVWRMRGGPRRSISVFLINDGGDITFFDSGIRGMGAKLALTASKLGTPKRVVLSHAHCDHRGAANELALPVLCHRDEIEDAQTDGDPSYFNLGALSLPGRRLTRFLHARWDGGAVRITDTMAEGDRIGPFHVIHLPGHAPGHIGLWRETDRLALTGDAFYRITPTTGRPCPPVTPPSAFNACDADVRRSLRRLAELQPRAAWPSHGQAAENAETQLLQLSRVEIR